MPTLDELSDKVAAPERRRISLAEFSDWFEDHPSSAYNNPDLHRAWAAVDAAFSEYYYDHIGEEAFREELANAIRKEP